MPKADTAGVQRSDAARKERPSRFTYALKAYSTEIRTDGWWIARTPFSSAGERPEWSGPFETIETACLAIARRLAVEVADRHTRQVEAHQIKAGQPLYGLKATTRLKPARNGKTPPSPNGTTA